MDTWLQITITAFTSVVGASGFWTWIVRKDQSRNATTRLLMGMAYDYITNRGIGFIERGWISKDELEELSKYYFEPYKTLGGNGVAERVMGEVKLLPLRSQSPYVEVLDRRSEHHQGWTNNVRVVDRTGQEATTE